MTRIESGALALVLLVFPEAAAAQLGGSLIPARPMVARRSGHTATLLLDVTVLIAGGWKENPRTTAAAAELYDPVQGVFREVGALTVPRARHSAVLLPDGRVLLGVMQSQLPSDKDIEGPYEW